MKTNQKEELKRMVKTSNFTSNTDRQFFIKKLLKLYVKYERGEITQNPIMELIRDFYLKNIGHIINKAYKDGGAK